MNRRRGIVVTLTVITASVALWTWRMRSPGVLAARWPDALAVVDDEPIAQGDIERHLGRPIRFLSAEQARGIIEEHASMRLLEREATDVAPAGGKAPPVSALVADRARERHAKTGPVTDADVERYYDAHRSDYVHGPRVRFAFAKVARGDGPYSARAVAISLAEQAEMNLGAREFSAFLVHAARYGETGETQVIACDGADPTHVPTSILERACAMRTGDVSPALEADGAWWVIRMVGREHAVERPFAQVRDDIRERLEDAAMADARQAVVRDILAASRLVIFEDRVARLTVGVGPETPLPTPPDVPGREGPEEEAREQRTAAPNA